MFLARMTAHEIENMASRFPERLSDAQIQKEMQSIQRKRRNLVRVFFKLRFYF